MTKQDLINIGMIALITILTLTLPGLLYQRGLPLPWVIALIAGYAAVAVLSFVMGKRLK